MLRLLASVRDRQQSRILSKIKITKDIEKRAKQNSRCSQRKWAIKCPQTQRWNATPSHTDSERRRQIRNLTPTAKAKAKTSWAMSLGIRTEREWQQAGEKINAYCCGKSMPGHECHEMCCSEETPRDVWVTDPEIAQTYIASTWAYYRAKVLLFGLLPRQSVEDPKVVVCCRGQLLVDSIAARFRELHNPG